MSILLGWALIVGLGACATTTASDESSSGPNYPRVLTDEELRANTIENVREVIDGGQLFGGTWYTEGAYLGGAVPEYQLSLDGNLAREDSCLFPIFKDGKLIGTASNNHERLGFPAAGQGCWVAKRQDVKEYCRILEMSEPCLLLGIETEMPQGDLTQSRWLVTESGEYDCVSFYEDADQNDREEEFARAQTVVAKLCAGEYGKVAFSDAQEVTYL